MTAPSDPRVLPMGEHALLVELDGLDAVLSLAAAVRDRVAEDDAPWGAVEDVVPAARTLLLTGDALDPGSLATAVEGLARELPPGVAPPGPLGTVEVAVRYDGPDLEDVAALTGLTVREVVAAHTGTPWRVAFGGFAPGFAYLTGGDARLRVPRRDEPRPSVPAGGVGLAGGFSGVYPRSSPGGWQLVGSTDVVLWDPERDPPALLRPGVSVRFVEAGRP